MTSSVRASFDGACEPFNPGGHIGLGWVINGVAHSENIDQANSNTNNIAEYLALTRVLEFVMADDSITELRITGDSQLVINQLNGEYAVRSAGILPHFEKVVDLIASLKARGCKVDIHWMPRESNTEADAASKAALVSHGVTIVQRKPPPGYTPRLGDIGKKLDRSAIKVGRFLEIWGMRNKDGTVTERALAEGYATTRFDGFGPVTDWNIARVVELLYGQDSITVKRKHMKSETAVPAARKKVGA